MRRKGVVGRRGPLRLEAERRRGREGAREARRARARAGGRRPPRRRRGPRVGRLAPCRRRGGLAGLDGGRVARRGERCGAVGRLWGRVKYPLPSPRPNSNALSGICFRSTHGFMSTGSQISWLARGGGHTASHFFTAASDPLVACYKRWTFGDPAAAAGDGLAGDGGSLALWRRWRSIDLAGRSVPEAMRRALLEIEAEAVSAAERGGASEFSGSVARELELISSFAV
mmetsp:Transcript_12965/g.38256  ORF Transcript_12965/g.38256 Transcript_12965/m.38256 type:complete len:228 (+) Transcript_12965:671-1354(+)